VSYWRLAPGQERTGTVVAFDEERGLGEVATGDHVTGDHVTGDHVEDRRQVLGFHCTAIADGSRTIPVGTKVHFVVRAGHRGRWEADRIRP
jgi:cold shock CspA family protein